MLDQMAGSATPSRMILPNALARRIFLHAHALAEPPTGPAKGADLHTLIDQLAKNFGL